MCASLIHIEQRDLLSQLQDMLLMNILNTFEKSACVISGIELVTKKPMTDAVIGKWHL